MAGVVALLAASVLLSGCGGDSVHVDGFHVSSSAQKACRDFLAGAPERVADQPRRKISGTSYAAAWGQPGEQAIVLRCGVGKPDGFTPTSVCQRVNGVDWFVPTSQIEDQRADALMTTIGRSPAVDVLVPAPLRPPDAVMVDLEKAIKAHTTRTTPCT